MSKLTKALTAAAGNAGGDNLYVEDVFSTYLYQGNSTSPPVITNSIDLADSGGMVWIKARTGATNHTITDTERGAGKEIYTDQTWDEQNYTGTYGINSFNSDGFSLIGANAPTNTSAYTYASWTFRKAEKFFDVVTWTGDGVTGRTVAHNLGSVPACIMIKRTDASSAIGWAVYHASSGNLALNLTSAQNQAFTNDVTSPTSTTFQVTGYTDVNGSGGTYVAYLFASDAGGFGDDGSENIIKCGSWNENSTNNVAVDCGFEPDFVMFKSAGAASSWYMADSMRGVPTPTSGTTTGNYIDTILQANSNAAEGSANAISLTSTGFIWYADGRLTNTAKWIYIAIRRPMKTPESGTEVFQAGTRQSTSPGFVSDFPVDMFMRRYKTGAGYPDIGSRLQGARAMQTSETFAESPDSGSTFDYMNGYYTSVSSDTNHFSWMFKRATGFMDVVCYNGDGTASRQITHNLGSAPEMIIVKCRSASNTYWETWHSSLPDDGSWASNVALNSTEGYGGFQRFDGAATQTAAYWTTGNNGEPNTSGHTYISYLFATLDGVSKVGSYTGTGSNVDVDCGFSAGARFILIKRTDSTGDWYVWDSARGIVAGNDPYLLLNTTAAEVTSTDYIDPLSSGFTVTSSAPAALNASGGSYIFLAIS